MIDITDATQRSTDKTDFRIRLNLIKELRQFPNALSQGLLLSMLQNDFVFSVRLAAWQALDEMGIEQKKPQIMRDRRFMEVFGKFKHQLIRMGVWCDSWSFLN
ncbi:hypothetical protein [Serratia sp. M24T3]|uniref:Uncharacterized protein n=1 Tax=Rouxiella sp. WC2420 TaxID=3234145 RepID=A0AB39VWP8_9GAMM|nr:hypothetical protein [Serratia sp. M24T3]EIC86186.1 hypothetical protein SPM24T3_02293 [Serratia sp. M24T3]